MKKYAFRWFVAFILILLCCFAKNCYQSVRSEGSVTVYIQEIKDEIKATKEEIADMQQAQHLIDEAKRKYDEAFWSTPYWYARWIYLKGQINFGRLSFLEGRLKDLERELFEINHRAPTIDSLRASLPTVIWLSLKSAGYATLVLWLTHLAWKCLIYYLLAPCISKRHFKLVDNAENYDWQCKGPDQRLTITAPAGQTISVKNQSFISKYDLNACTKTTQWMMTWSHPIMCLLENLTIMTRFTPINASESVCVDLSPENPDAYLSCIKLSDQPIYIAPAAIVAYTGTMKLNVTWRYFFNIAAWAMGRVRFYTATGNGYLIMQGIGKLADHDVTPPSEGIVMKANSIAAAGCNFRFGVKANETFIPYLLGEADLFDTQLLGSGHALQTTSLPGTSLLARTRDSALAIVGKFLGL